MFSWDVFLEPADTDAPAQWIGTIQAATQAQALTNAAQFYEKADHDLTVKRQPTSAVEWDTQAIQCAVDQAPQDMIATPVIVTGASLYQKKNVAGEDLQVQGLRWYVEVGLRNINEASDEYGTEATALYRVWRDQGQWKAVRVELY
jgi:hypothetical protein